MYRGGTLQMNLYYSIYLIEAVFVIISFLLINLKKEESCSKTIKLFEIIIFSLTIICGLLITVFDFIDLIENYFMSFTITTGFLLLNAVLIWLFKEKYFRLNKRRRGLIIVSIAIVSTVIFICFM